MSRSGRFILPDSERPSSSPRAIGKRREGVRVLCFGGALLALATLAGLTLAAAPARATYAGANGKIACEGTRAVQGNAANSEVYTINPDGTEETVLTANTVRDGDPAISPDGRNIVFESFRAVGSEAWRMVIDGSNPVRLTTN